MMKQKIIFTILFVFLSALVAISAQELIQEEIDIENLHIRAITPALEIDTCEEVQYFFDLKNIGSFQDTFDLGVDPLAIVLNTWQP